MRSRARRQSAAVIAAAAICLAACGAPADIVTPARNAVDAFPAVAQEPTTNTTTATTVVATTSVPAAPLCRAENAVSHVPESVTAAVNAAAAHPGFGNVDVGVSVWIDGWGEVLAVNPDLQLAPASNQKLLVAIGAYELLEPESRLRTTIETVGDDLVLRAGADPTLTTNDLEALATEVAAAGVVAVDRLIIDTTQYPQGPRADGWFDWQIPRYVGPLSAFMVDNNRWTQDPSFLLDPAIANGEQLATKLHAAGIDVASVEVGPAPPGTVVAAHESPTIHELVSTMLLTSDNQHADLLLMELGRVATGQGTLASGANAIASILTDLCTDVDGSTADGSGLSRGNQRSAREFQQLLLALDPTTRDRLHAQLPVNGVSGTMTSRLSEDPGRVHAKTGTIIGGRSLSGYTSTADGRDIVFSTIVNGEPEAATASLSAIDGLIAELLQLEG